MTEAEPWAGALEPGTSLAGYTVLEQREEQPDMRVYRAQAPADLCTQCGTRATEPNARFCETCGAELLPRDVLVLEPIGEQPKHGPWLALSLPDDPRQALLPPLTPLQHGDSQLLVVEETIPGWQSLAELLASYGATPDQPAALEDDDALLIARQLADVLAYLHSNKVALGELSLAHLLIGPQGRFRLRDVNDLEPLTPELQRTDLQRLQQTTEEITRLPRTTQKLDSALLNGEQPRSVQDVLALARANQLPDAAAWVAALDAVQQSQRAITPLQTHIAARSDVGQVRELNEDALLTLHLDATMLGRDMNAGLYVVADGMGGHAAGEIASGLAIQSMTVVAAPALIEVLADSANGVSADALRTLATRAASQANDAVYREGQQRGNDMGTTLTFALVVGDRCVVGNVGDSRTYLLRNGQLQRVTRDHSLVQRLVDMGQITPDEVYTHPHRNAILRSLGEHPQVETDLFELRLQPGDALLCCSDGLWEMVRDDRLQEMLTNAEAQAVVEQAVDEANRNGGEDNITAVLIQFAARTTTNSPVQVSAMEEEQTDV
jgi:protein phosphatase